MAHTAAIVEFRELNDEFISYCIRCCGDNKTDSWHTISVHVSDAEHDANLTDQQAAVAARHEAKVKALARAGQTVSKD